MLVEIQIESKRHIEFLPKKNGVPPSLEIATQLWERIESSQNYRWGQKILIVRRRIQIVTIFLKGAVKFRGKGDDAWDGYKFSEEQTATIRILI
jgi:hypothetical protein